MNRNFLAMLMISALVACGGGDSTTDAGTDTPLPDAVDDVADVPDDPGTDTESDVPPTDAQDETGPADVPEELPLFENGATAFLSTEPTELVQGPMAAGVVGDVVLQNRHVRFVVRNQERSLFSPYGGALVDADRVRGEGEPGGDQFFEVFPMVGMGRVFKPSSVQVVDDGKHTGTAIVRFEGTEGGMTLIDSILPTMPTGLTATTDYVLGPDARHVEIVTTAHNPQDYQITALLGQFLQFGKRLVKFHDGCGLDGDCLSGKSDLQWLAGGGEGVSYGVAVPEGSDLSLLLAYDALLLLEAGTFEIDPGQSVTVRSYLAVGDGTIEDVVRQVKALRNEAPGTAVPLKVTLADEHSAMKDAYVQVRRTGASAKTRWATSVIPDANGDATVHLAPGTYDFVLGLPGAPDTVVEAVVIGETPPAEPVALAANPAGFLRVRVTDGDGDPLIASAVLQNGHDAAWLAGTLTYQAVRDGDWTFPVRAGDYTLTVSKGMTWGIDRRNVTVTAGQIAEVDAQIVQEIDTTGYLMINTHEHSERSIDSEVRAEDRVYNAIANGVDIMNPTDHDFFGSFQQTIEDLGVEELVHSFLGCEVSPLWGHTTATGCRNPPPYPTYFAVDFTLYDEDGYVDRGLTASEIYRQARDVFQCEFVAVNHPYRGGPTFETYGIDDKSDPADAMPDLDLSLVDAVEVYNKYDDVEVITGQNITAWFNLLNRGYHIAAIGGSDEHGFGGSYGNPRNLVPSTRTVAEGIDQTEVFDAMKAFRSQVIGGPVLALTVDGKAPGDTVEAVAGKVTVHLQVRAPSWMGLDFAHVFVNGVRVAEFTPADTTDVLRVDETFELDLMEDAHIVAMSGSTTPAHEMVPVSKKFPFSNTNPVFVDVDGGGYTPIYQDGAPWDE
jgi:hypothetical protein